MSKMLGGNKAKEKQKKNPVSREDFSSILDEWVTKPIFSESIKEAVAPELNKIREENRLLKETVDKNSARIAILENKLRPAQNGSTPYKTALQTGSTQDQGGKSQAGPASPVTRGEVVQILKEETNKNRLSDNLFKLRVTGLKGALPWKDLAKENMKLKVISMAKSIDIDLFPIDFSTELISSKNSDGKNVTRGVLIKFNTIWKKQELYKARIGLTGKDIFLSEILDKKAQELFYLVRQLKRDKIIENCWTFNSTVYAKANGNTIKVQTKEHYQRLIDDLYKTDAAESEIFHETHEIISIHDSEDEEELDQARPVPDGPSATSTPIPKAGPRAPGVPETSHRLPSLSISESGFTAYGFSDDTIARAEAVFAEKSKKLKIALNEESELEEAEAVLAEKRASVAKAEAMIAAQREKLKKTNKL